MNKLITQIVVGLILALTAGMSGYGILNWYANQRMTAQNKKVENKEYILNRRLNPALNKQLAKDQELAKRAIRDIENEQK